VDGTTYFYLRALGSKDHGRPWVKLGPGGLAELTSQRKGLSSDKGRQLR
jgi:hypothetical protein